MVHLLLEAPIVADLYSSFEFVQFIKYKSWAYKNLSDWTILSNFHFEFILNISSLCLVGKICVKQFLCFIALI